MSSFANRYSSLWKSENSSWKKVDSGNYRGVTWAIQESEVSGQMRLISEVGDFKGASYEQVLRKFKQEVDSLKG